jgi:hypothetical protein
MLYLCKTPGQDRPAARLLVVSSESRRGSARDDCFRGGELSRAGLRVRRLVRRLRWTDGAVHLWLGRRAGPGRGESSSDLRFDVAETD